MWKIFNIVLITHSQSTEYDQFRKKGIRYLNDLHTKIP